MPFTPVVISLPIADRRASFEFYRHALGLDPIGGPAADGIGTQRVRRQPERRDSGGGGHADQAGPASWGRHRNQARAAAVGLRGGILRSRRPRLDGDVPAAAFLTGGLTDDPDRRYACPLPHHRSELEPQCQMRLSARSS